HVGVDHLERLLPWRPRLRGTGGPRVRPRCPGLGQDEEEDEPRHSRLSVPISARSASARARLSSSLRPATHAVRFGHSRAGAAAAAVGAACSSTARPASSSAGGSADQAGGDGAAGAGGGGLAGGGGAPVTPEATAAAPPEARAPHPARRA